MVRWRFNKLHRTNLLWRRIISEKDSPLLLPSLCDRSFLPVLHDVREWQLQMLVWRFQLEVFCVEVDQGVQQHLKSTSNLLSTKSTWLKWKHLMLNFSAICAIWLTRWKLQKKYIKRASNVLILKRTKLVEKFWLNRVWKLINLANISCFLGWFKIAISSKG